jgi:hypothetical protein
VPANPPLAQEALVFTHRRTFIALLAIAALLAGASTAGAHSNRWNSPTSSLAGTSEPRQDLRSPDARDAARVDEIAAQMRAFKPAPITAPQPAPVAAPSDDTPWTLLAGTLLAAFTLGAGAAASLMYLRRARPSTLARS